MTAYACSLFKVIKGHLRLQLVIKVHKLSHLNIWDPNREIAFKFGRLTYPTKRWAGLLYSKNCKILASIILSQCTRITDDDNKWQTTHYVNSSMLHCNGWLKNIKDLRQVAVAEAGRLATCVTDEPFTSRSRTSPFDRQTANSPAKSWPGFHAKSTTSSPTPSWTAANGRGWFPCYSQIQQTYLLLGASEI